METTSTPALLAHHGDALRAVAQRAEPGDVVGVQMGVDRLDQLQVELLHQLEVAVHLLQHGVDDQRLAAAPAGEQVGVGAGHAVEELAEDHGVPFLMSNLANCVGSMDQVSLTFLEGMSLRSWKADIGLCAAHVCF